VCSACKRHPQLEITVCQLQQHGAQLIRLRLLLLLLLLLLEPLHGKLLLNNAAAVGNGRQQACSSTHSSTLE
jgi:hypothetical protein